LEPVYNEAALKALQDGSDPEHFSDTDWRGLVLNDWAPQTKHTVTFSGGGENSKFYASLGHIYQNSLYKNDNHFMKRTNFRLSVETGLRDLGLTFRGAIDGYRQHNQHPYTSTANGYGQVFSHINDKLPTTPGLNKYGSDYFAPGHRWGTFFSGSLGWVVTKEKFMQPLVDRNILNLLKIRASYGETGLDSSAGRFAYLTSYNLNNEAYVVDGKYVPGFSEGADIYFSYLRWGKYGGYANHGRQPGDVVYDLDRPVYKIEISRDRKTLLIGQHTLLNSATRSFTTKRYLLPIAQSFLNTRESYGLDHTQNPEW
jgi:hypothetical protein